MSSTPSPVSVSPFFFAAAQHFSQQIIVGIGDWAVSDDGGALISTYGLGSCVALAIYDPAVKVGGLLHYMLPDATISPDKAEQQPALFGSTGLPLIFRQLEKLQADPDRFRVFAAGGASVLGGTDLFRVGERNVDHAITFLLGRGISCQMTCLGGTENRSLHLELGTGIVTVHSPFRQTQHSLQAGM